MASADLRVRGWGVWAGVKGLSQLGGSEARSCHAMEGPLDEGLVCREWKAKLVSFLFFPPKFHSDNSRKANLACVALQDLSIRGQGLARPAVEARPPSSLSSGVRTNQGVDALLLRATCVSFLRSTAGLLKAV